MKDLTAFKNQIFLYTVIVSLILEVLSLPFLGFDKGFLYGLALGTAVAIVNFNILAFSSKQILKGGRSYISFVSYLGRLLIYGFAFFMAMQVGLTSGLGSILGFLTLRIAIIYLHGIKAKFDKTRKVRPEVAAAYARMDKAKEEHRTTRFMDRVRKELSYQDDFWEDELPDEDGIFGDKQEPKRRHLRKTIYKIKS